MPFKIFLFALIFVFTTTLFSETTTTAKSVLVSVDQNLTAEKLAHKRVLEEQAQQEKQKNELIKSYTEALDSLASQIRNENMWMKSYASYLTSLKVRKNLEDIKKRIRYLSNSAKTLSDKDKLNGLIAKEEILASQIGKLKGNKNVALFSDLITPPKIDKVPEILNPFDILTGLSLIKTLDLNFEEYKQKKANLSNLIELLKEQYHIYKQLKAVDTSKKYDELLKQKQMQLEMFERALDTMNVTMDVYEKRLEVAEININKGIERQVYGLMKIAAVVLFVFIIFFLLKLIVKKYITDNERFYMANKIITFTNFIVIILILFFNYIENASYIVTILGFASAGIAIAMKDWFMSLLGWLVIVFGGSIHVGDRIRVDLNGMKYVGDVLDISFLRITILEDITLTSIMTNRRAGRIIFIPNNYVFTQMIANYTHYSLKTVWDGVKITITFDSNHKKAMHLVKEITKKYSKGYTDITRKQLNKLRQHYSLKNTNVEPRIFSFIEPSGIDIEAWYFTNAYGTLTLRSAISTEIIDAFQKEDDITIAYPTQKLNISMHSEAPIEHNHEMV
ncbi:mechanosensitive ion channel domain-containing protein [Sulfurimonas sp.]|uniref:mechanosensitive ion channel family protein n=1 Tax=Sulfurimonas sp. TaxID=2022749 RepID=UPI0026326918|nr:mechanosensitive ion channel domain-containing protein [Sulfurimonas sp.]